MDFTRISEIVHNQIPIEWHGTFEDGVIEETVYFENGATLSMRLEIDEKNEEHNDEEEEIDDPLYVMVGTEEEPQLVHRDILDTYLEVMENK
jgi:hypothetical protein